MAICPNSAIEIHGRELSPNDLFDLPTKNNTANYQQLLALLQGRRSVREFKDKPVEKEKINKIIEAAQTAPMGLPPSDVHILVFDSKEKSNAFAKDFCEYLEGMKLFVSNWILALLRPFVGKKNHSIFKNFVQPLVKVYTEKNKEGINPVSYNAPLAMYFYATPYADPADPIIVATYTMLVAESLGLGTCMLGAIHPLIQNGKSAKKLKEKYNIKHTSREVLFVIIGYPSVKYKKGIKRTFASVDFA